MNVCGHCGEQIVMIEEVQGEVGRWYHQKPSDPRDQYLFCRLTEATPASEAAVADPEPEPEPVLPGEGSL